MCWKNVCTCWSPSGIISLVMFVFVHLSGGNPRLLHTTADKDRIPKGRNFIQVFFPSVPQKLASGNLRHCVSRHGISEQSEGP